MVRRFRSIQTLINNQTPTTGIFCAVNEEALDDLLTNSSVVDLVGHHLVDEVGSDSDITSSPKSLNFLSYSQNLFADYTYFKNIDGATSGTEITDTGVSPNTGLDVLPETGTLIIDNIFNATGDSGIPVTDFAAYNSSARDGGAIFIQTEFTNPTFYSTQLTTLEGFVSVSPSAPAPKWVLGKVTSNLPTPGYLGFYVGDLVKLKVLEAKYVTNNSLPVGYRQQLRLRLSHPLISASPSTTYVEPWYETNKSAVDAYQIGSPDYFDRDDVFFSPDIPVGADSYLAYENSAMYRDWVAGNIGDGDTDWLDDSG